MMPCHVACWVLPWETFIFLTLDSKMALYVVLFIHLTEKMSKFVGKMEEIEKTIRQKNVRSLKLAKLLHQIKRSDLMDLVSNI